MDAFVTWISEQIMQQGLSMSLLALAVAYFNKRQSVLEEKLDKAQTEIVTFLKEDRQELITLMEQNKDVMEQNVQVMKRIEVRIS
jgi:hypothetical protein